MNKNKMSLFLKIAFITLYIFLIAILDIKRYDETCSNPPSESQLEEEVEMIFLTTDLYIIETDDCGDGSLIVTIRVYTEDGYRIYRCLYKVERRWIGDFVWKMERYV